MKTGGVSRYVHDILDCKITQFHYVLFNTSRPEKKIIKPGTGYIELFNSGLLRSIQAIFITLTHMISFPFYLLTKKIDIVHVCGVSFWVFWENAYYIFVSKIFGIPITIHYLGALDLYFNSCSNTEKYLIKLVLNLPDKVILLSKKAQILAETIIPSPKLAIIPSNVNITSFTNNLTKRKSLEDGIVRILFVGGADPFRKGIYDVINSIALVAKENLNIKFIFSGGKSIQSLANYWEDLGLSDYIEYIGWIPEESKVDLYHQVDILVLPSYNEGLPYVIIEALASGLPIVASTIGGIPEVILNGENGYLIEPGDTNTLAKYIALLVKDKALRESIRLKNISRAEQNYSSEKLIKELETIFEEVH